MGDEKDTYLSLMSFSSAEEAYEQLKTWASDLSDEQHFIRSCIFDLHAAVEVELRRVYYHTFHAQLFLTDDEEANAKTVADFEKVIVRLGFMEMFRVLRPVLLSWPYKDLESIQAVNETRNLAAHGGDIAKVLYKGRNPFTDGDCFAQLYFDVWAIRQTMHRFFDQAVARPKRLLERYIEKYGPGLL